MGKIIISENVSLDGVIQDPTGDEGFRRGGWLGRITGETGQVLLEEALMEHDLVDELRLMIYPVVVGAGERLFGETSNKKPVRLIGTRTVGDGIAFLAYAPSGHDRQ